VVIRLSRARRPGVGAKLYNDPSGNANGFIALADAGNIGHARRPGAGAKLNGPSGDVTNDRGSEGGVVAGPLRDNHYHVPLGVVARGEIGPPPTLKLHGLVHGELSSGGVASVVGRRGSDGRKLITSGRLSGSLQDPLELQLPLQVALGQLLHNAIIAPLKWSLIRGLLRIHDEWM
jgi:hypothetical protein